MPENARKLAGTPPIWMVQAWFPVNILVNPMMMLHRSVFQIPETTNGQKWATDGHQWTQKNTAMCWKIG